jgi:uncharacterized protein YcbK (DUF882 family)
MLLASCTSSGTPDFEAGMPGYNSPTMTASSPAQTGTGFAQTGEQVSAAATASATPTGEDGKLPDQVAYLPTANPAAALSAAPQAAEAAQAEATKPGETASAAATAGAETKPGDTVQATAPTPAAKPASDAAESQNDRPADGEVIATAAPYPQTEQPAPKKKTFFGSLFGTASASAAPSPMINQDRSTAAVAKRPQPAKAVIENSTPSAFIENRPGKRVIEEEPAKTIVDLDPEKLRKPVELASYNGDDNGLPGVRQSALFEIKRKSGIDDDSDVDIHEEDDESPVRLASAAGMARLAPNGLLKQTESVDVACLKPSLVRVLKTIEQRYGRKLVVTSGYRSRLRNIRARGAKNSLHMYCAAADIQVPGVSKWELATFARAMPGRGGVGTYCHTDSVHVDVGPERDWNWRCRRRK